MRIARFLTLRLLNGAVTTTDRRGVLRAGAGLVAGGALAAGCASTGAAPHSAASSVASSGPSDTASPQTAPAPRAFPRQPAQITHGPCDRPRVALTFHGQGDPALARYRELPTTPKGTPAPAHEEEFAWVIAALRARVPAP